MINLDPIMMIKAKLKLFSYTALLGGFIFILLGVGIIFIPQIIQYIFVVAFVIFGLMLFIVSIKIDHLSSLICRFEIFGTLSKNKRKK